MAVKIEIVSPERLVFSATAQSVTLPGAEGYFTVLGDHAPLMSVLKPGFVTVANAQQTDIFYVRGGFADVSAEGVTILAEESSPLADFDVSSVEALLAKAEAEAQTATSEHRSVAEEAVYDLRNFLMEAQTVQARVAPL